MGANRSNLNRRFGEIRIRGALSTTTDNSNKARQNPHSQSWRLLCGQMVVSISPLGLLRIVRHGVLGQKCGMHFAIPRVCLSGEGFADEARGQATKRHESDAVKYGLTQLEGAMDRCSTETDESPPPRQAERKDSEGILSGYKACPLARRANYPLYNEPHRIGPFQ